MDNVKTFGYARVSSKDQNLDRQLDSLKQYVPDERNIYCDKMSGKDFNRPMFMALKSTLRNGDTLYIHELERLGRNKQEVKENLEYFKDNGIIVRILNLPTTLIDYTQFKDNKLQQMMMDMVNSILIEVLATMAEAERDNILKRQKEGIASAHKRGVRFGRPIKELPELQWEQDYTLWKNKRVTAVSLIRKYNIASSTFYKKVKEYELLKRHEK